MIARTSLILISVFGASFAQAATLRDNVSGRTVRCYAPSGNATDYRFNADASEADEFFFTARIGMRRRTGRLRIRRRQDIPEGEDKIPLFYAEGGIMQMADGQECEFKD